MKEFRNRFISDYQKELVEYIPSGKVDLPVVFDSDDEGREETLAINASFHGNCNKLISPDI